MKGIKLVSVDVRKRGQKIETPGFHNPEAARRRLDVIDLIQGEMNEGYAIGPVRLGHDNSIYLHGGVNGVCSDGTTVSFGEYGPGKRDPAWVTSDYLARHIPLTQKDAHSDLVRLAEERGYGVELVD